MDSLLNGRSLDGLMAEALTREDGQLANERMGPKTRVKSNFLYSLLGFVFVYVR